MVPVLLGAIRSDVSTPAPLPDRAQGIVVLHFGRVTERRLAVLNALAERGLRVKSFDSLLYAQVHRVCALCGVL